MFTPVYFGGCSSDKGASKRKQEVMLSKFDIESTYRMVPVHPED